MKARLNLEYSNLAFNKHYSVRIPDKNNKIEMYSSASALCLRRSYKTLDFSTPGPISFSNGPDCTIILFSECFFELKFGEGVNLLDGSSKLNVKIRYKYILKKKNYFFWYFWLTFVEALSESVVAMATRDNLSFHFCF